MHDILGCDDSCMHARALILFELIEANISFLAEMSSTEEEIEEDPIWQKVQK